MPYDSLRKTNENNSADHPRPMIHAEPLQEVKLATAKQSDRAKFSIKRLDGKGIRFVITASFQPKGKRTSLLSKKYIDDMQAIGFGKELPHGRSSLLFTVLEYDGDVPNEMVFTFHFVPIEGVHDGVVHIRCDDFITAIAELKKQF